MAVILVQSLSPGGCVSADLSSCLDFTPWSPFPRQQLRELGKGDGATDDLKETRASQDGRQIVIKDPHHKRDKQPYWKAEGKGGADPSDSGKKWSFWG